MLATKSGLLMPVKSWSKPSRMSSSTRRAIHGRSAFYLI